MGKMPLVNNLKKLPEQEDILYPLVINQCLVCSHKQLSVAVDRKLLFQDYLYKTGTSSTHIEFFMDFFYGLNIPIGKVLDIGCNDGSLLLEFKDYGWDCVGVEPSEGVADEAKYEGIRIVTDFFPTDKIKGKFNLITAFNVFAHNDDPHNFLKEMVKLLKEDGRIYIITTPSRLDNYYHEHISYFTPQSMMVLALRCGVKVVSFKTVSMHGESYLFEIKKHEIKATPFPPLGNFIAYGASASEIVLFNYYKIIPEYVVDDNPLKQGKFIPGVNSPIVSADYLAKDKRDLTIIVAHNLFEEISANIKKLRPKRKDKLERLI